MTNENVKTLADLLKSAAEEFGGKIWLKQKKGADIEEKSFNDLYGDAQRINGYLRSLGGKQHAAVIGGTSYNYLVSWFGTAIGGNVTVPLDAQLSCGDICDLLRRADVTVFFYDGRFEKLIPEIKTECPNVREYVCLDSLDGILGSYGPEAPDGISPGDLAAIVYTSGTTGKSKGVMLTHGNYIDNTFCGDNESSSEDVLLSVLPIHHIYCFTCDVLLSIRYGATVCVNESMMRIPQNLKLFSPTIILLVPMIAATIYRQIKAAAAAKPDIPARMIAQSVFGGRLKGIYSGGAYLPPELLQGYLDLGIPIAQGYGMTECSPRISTANINTEISTAGDVGTIVKGCEVTIADGEIVVKSPSVMKGYYKDPEETAKTLDPDGRLHTGDLGYVENNRIFITGRKKNLIILSNGENVSPEDLENKFAGIDIAAEVLVYAEDSVITAEIFPNPELAANMSAEEVKTELERVIAKINGTVSSSKTIRKLKIRDTEFEKTTSKKIKRKYN
ncbi:MAG: AMP-binding protein [Ruminococcus sp.]|nr:AMP-binding protein [Ruminococcus sp.]